MKKNYPALETNKNFTPDPIFISNPEFLRLRDHLLIPATLNSPPVLHHKNLVYSIVTGAM